MRVSVIGAGFVGVVTAACLAEKGSEVVLVDVDSEKVDKVNRALPPMYEEGLQDVLERNVGAGLRATGDLRRAVLDTDVSLIAVGTPTAGSAIDLRFVEEVSREVGAAIAAKPGYHTVIDHQEHCGARHHGQCGASDPRRDLRQDCRCRIWARDESGVPPSGNRGGRLMDPDRIVIGGIDDQSLDTMEELYAAFGGTDIVRTTPRTAEMIKYAANSLLATMISYSNEIANLCAAIGDVDAIEVLEGVRLDRRLTPIQPDGVRVVPGLMDYLYPGCGFGGSCFPKDVQALISFGEGSSMSLLEAVIGINDRQPG